MKRFVCPHCQSDVYFDNTACVTCGRELGYVPDIFEMAALDPQAQEWKTAIATGVAYIACENRQHSNACNWLHPAGSVDKRCVACQHNRTIPDLSIPINLTNWKKIELAKRHLFYSLMRWRLPMPTRGDNPQAGLAFDFLADVVKADGTVVESFLTGHETGLITINIAEADDAERERRRASMGEPYRTLLGHFRHEVGHYYWDRLVHDRGKVERSRELFGDETQSYGDALKRHYESGPPADWQKSFISTYATAHPWEDFAETWAHYIHMVDGLETARVFGVNVQAKVASANTAPQKVEVEFDPYFVGNAQALVEAWVPLTVALNSVNRSMGQPDLYPFVLSPPVIEKLQFMHEIIHS